MDANFWKEKWERGEIQFHQNQSHPQLVAHFSGVSPRRVMVPLCGKSNDLIWLRAQKHEVVGIELSSIACDAFFAENKISFEKAAFDKGTLYQSDGISLWCCDFFDVPASAWDGCTAVYDRAASIALPLDVRQKYSESVVQNFGKQLGPDRFVLLIAIEYAEGSFSGPPFPIYEAEIKESYGKSFEIELIHSKQDDHSLSGRPPQFSTVQVVEKTYILRAR